MTSPTIIALDFDYTCSYVAPVIVRRMRDIAGRYGVLEQWDYVYPQVVEQGFTLEGLCEGLVRCTSHVSVDTLRLAMESKLFTDLDNYLYEDVVPKLREWRQRGIRIVIITRGNPDWQRHKVELSGLLTVVSESDVVYVAEGTKAETLAVHLGDVIPEKLIFADDSVQELNEMRAHNWGSVKIVTYHMRRPRMGDGPEWDEFERIQKRIYSCTHRHPTIHSFAEVLT